MSSEDEIIDEAIITAKGPGDTIFCSHKDTAWCESKPKYPKEHNISTFQGNPTGHINPAVRGLTTQASPLNQALELAFPVNYWKIITRFTNDYHHIRYRRTLQHNM